MKKIALIELSKKISFLVQKNVGSHFSIEPQATDTALTLKISSGDLRYIKEAKAFLKPYNIPRRNNRKNHGSGMKYTILLNIEGISVEIKKRIEEDFKEATKDCPRRKISPKEKKVLVKPTFTLLEKEETKEEKPKRTRTSSPTFPYSRFLTSFISFEDLEDVKRDINGSEVNISGSLKSLSSIVRATNYFYGKEFTLSPEGVLVVNTESETIFSVAKEFPFVLPPSPEETVDSIVRKLNRALPNRRYTVKKDEGRFLVQTNSKKIESLLVALIYMGWAIEENRETCQSFHALPKELEEVQIPLAEEVSGKLSVEAREEILSSDTTDHLPEEETIDDIYRQLISIRESPDFILLGKSLRKEVISRTKKYEENELARQVGRLLHKLEDHENNKLKCFKFIV